VGFHPGIEQRGKEPEPLNVIHVQVSEKNVDPVGAGQLGADGANSRTGVEQDRLAVWPGYLHAGGVTSVADGVRPGRGH
jgi:hypothetical protein